MQFHDFNLAEPLLEAVAKQGYEAPSEIQKEAIPVLLDGDRDLVGQAQTGTGKTAAFVLPLLQKLYEKEKRGIRALILTPTRELAAQVEGEIQKFNILKNCRSVVVYGGTSYDKQISQLRKRDPQIIVGTPGRVIDLMERGLLDFSDAEYFILDEADEMLNMGFFDDVQKVLGSFNKKRSMWMFSATMPREITELIEEECYNPYTVKVKKSELSNANIEQKFFTINRRQRFEVLYRLIACSDDIHGIVFCRTKMDTKEVAESLVERGLNVSCLNGDMGQAERDNAMAKFKSHKSNIMVCTDVAARGIDVNDLTHVFNYGLPQNVESYVHRIGRTGRAGKTGVAFSLVDPGDLYLLRKIERTIKKSIDKGAIPSSKVLKSKLMTRNMQRIGPIKDAVLSKGDDYKIDPTYAVYQEFFKDTTKEDLQKIMFTYIFNKDLKRLDELGDFKTEKKTRGRRERRFASKGGSQDKGARGHSGKRNSDRRGPDRRRRKGGAESEGAGQKRRSFRK